MSQAVEEANCAYSMVLAQRGFAIVEKRDPDSGKHRHPQKAIHGEAHSI